MDLAPHIASLERTAVSVTALLEGVAPDERGWRPDPGQWSLVEIAAHLLDEEREDFRVRLDHTLHRPGEAWPPIDPSGWVASRDYATRDLDETVAAFRIERERSVAWLKGLVEPDWNLAYEHPAFGRIRAGDLLAAWSGHDILHLRQILKRRWARLGEQAHPYHLEYAGAW